jgi:hypothetical protein
VSATFKPYGLRPVRTRHGGEIRSQRLVGGFASAYAANVTVGDPLKLVTGGVFELAAATDAISAVFAGVLMEDGGVWQQSQYWASGRTYTKPPQVLYYDVRQYEFAIQGAGSIAQTAIGDAADWVAGTPNLKAGTSGGYLASGSLAGAAASAQLKIINLFEKPGNTWGDTYTEVIVAVNELNLGFEPGNAI